MTEEQLHDIGTYETSNAFDSREKAALDYAVAMTKTPVDVSDELFERMRAHFSEEQLIELTAVIAQENFRARFNRPFRVEPAGFSEGAFCPMPER
jgi:4-carboxymuconolactone decarboxylase